MMKAGALLLLIGVMAAIGTWIYMARVLIPYQISDFAAHGRPRGNFSDLYPRWLGARELLLHGRDPYSYEITREIQAGYYGRPLDPNRTSDPKDQQGFVYPLYIVFYLAPTVHASFASVQRIFFWILVTITILSVPIWLHVLGWHARFSTQMSVVALTLGSLGVMQGLKLQQLTLFVAPLIALALLSLIKGQQAIAGGLLALATIKPQLVWLFFLTLVIWTTADWQRRRRWLASFTLTMMVMAVASEFMLPGWIGKFFHAISEYQNYTGNVSVVEQLIPSPWNWLLEIAAVGALMYLAWAVRASAATSKEFVETICGALAITIFLLPALSPYNQVLLLPAILLAIHERHSIWKRGPAFRVLLLAPAALLAWPWLIASLLAALSYVIDPVHLQKYWAVPFWTSLDIPVSVGALMLFYTFRTQSTSPVQQQSA